MFSIIICTYNGGNRIGRILDCILEQYNLDKYVDEIIIVDNCSTDNTKIIINNYLNKYSKIVYLFEENPGLSNARLCGVRYCKSEWIIFLDDDNFIQYDWIDNAAEYIKSRKNMGAFNGHVVPKFNNALSDEQSKLLEASYIGLACSTYSQNEITKVDESKWSPFGAGLVIRTEPLKELAERGWLKSEGRKLNQVISGEDTEMTGWVKEKGFSWGFCNDLLLYHEIGKNRLTLKYLDSLYHSFGVANYVAISKKKYALLRKIKWLLIEVTMLLKAKIGNLFFHTSDVNYYRNLLAISRAKGYIECIKNKK